MQPAPLNYDIHPIFFAFTKQVVESGWPPNRMLSSAHPTGFNSKRSFVIICAMLLAADTPHNVAKAISRFRTLGYTITRRTFSSDHFRRFESSFGSCVHLSTEDAFSLDRFPAIALRGKSISNSSRPSNPIALFTSSHLLSALHLLRSAYRMNNTLRMGPKQQRVIHPNNTA